MQSQLNKSVGSFYKKAKALLPKWYVSNPTYPFFLWQCHNVINWHEEEFSPVTPKNPNSRHHKFSGSEYNRDWNSLYMRSSESPDVLFCVGNALEGVRFPRVYPQQGAQTLRDWGEKAGHCKTQTRAGLLFCWFALNGRKERVSVKIFSSIGNVVSTFLLRHLLYPSPSISVRAVETGA